jgi:Bacterial regulatory protein, Fis family
MAVPLVVTERAAIVDALWEHRGNVAAAALDLQIGKTTLYRKLSALSIREADYIGPAADEAHEMRLDHFHQQIMAAQIERMRSEHAEILRMFHAAGCLSGSRLEKVREIARLAAELSTPPVRPPKEVAAA